MTISPGESGSVFSSCLQEGLRQSQDVIKRWCSRLADLLYERSRVLPDLAQRRSLQDAVGALKENRAFIESGFAEQLASAVGEDMRQRSARQPGSPSHSFSPLSFDQLELMGDDQVQEAVEGGRLHQVIKLASEAGLTGFGARLSSAQGFQRVRADKNPLRPEVVSHALFTLLQAAPVTSQTRACWLGYGAQLMGEELESLYVSMDKMLAEQGVLPAPYGVLGSTQGRDAEPGSPAPERVTAALQSAYFTHTPLRDSPLAQEGLGQNARQKMLTLDHMHRLLAGDYDASFKDLTLASGHDFEDEPVAHEFAHTVPAALDLLMELEEKGIAPVRRAAPPPLVQMRARLKTGAKSLGQALAIEVVGLMIERLANDSRLLMPVRQVIVNTEPAFLRLAVTDPRFFSDKNHPARRLLEVMTHASLAYASENAAGFPEFMRNLRQTAALLTEEHASDARHFATLLQAFEDAQARQDQPYLEAQRRAIQALLQAEQRNMLAEKIAREIRARPDFVAGNRIITAFLTGPWAQVMARERLLGDHERAGPSKTLYSRTVGDLLWSLDFAQVSGHRKRLLKVIPEMLESLREGLLSIDYPLDQSRSFFDEIMVIHRVGLQAPPQASGMACKHRGRLEDMFASAEAFEPSRPWLAPAEARHSGFMDDWDNQGAVRPKTRLKQPAAPEGVALQLGDWVELLVELQWLRAQLTWISPHNTLFMFTSEGGRKHSMTDKVLLQLLQLELVKVISQQGVVEGALDGVARTAMRNSLGRDAIAGHGETPAAGPDHRAS